LSPSMSCCVHDVWLYRHMVCGERRLVIFHSAMGRKGLGEMLDKSCLGCLPILLSSWREEVMFEESARRMYFILISLRHLRLCVSWSLKFAFCVAQVHPSPRAHHLRQVAWILCHGISRNRCQQQPPKITPHPRPTEMHLLHWRPWQAMDYCQIPAHAAQTSVIKQPSSPLHYHVFPRSSDWLEQVASQGSLFRQLHSVPVRPQWIIQQREQQQ
jgi:hypothetical protein